ncbi:MAG TPA: cbb3-type cytochrome c oxidase subunit I [Gemmatimonadales bacterium]|nr:cbb3-type cytochrome c oxidase subunit I [Gemmatimonadales bacterium]
MTTDRPGTLFPHSRLILANLWVAILAFGVAAAMAMMQAISRANLELPFRSAGMYYMSVTAHGVLMALVFTTFFIMGLGYAVAEQENGGLRMPRLAWASWTVATLGTLLALGAIFAFKASVLYTFYPPLQAHPLFYIGLTLLVVGSWGWCAEMVASWREARRRQGERPVTLALHATTANAILWILCTIGVASEMLFQLIPWSLGWMATIDPLLSRMLFWYFGHPLVYFWVLPAYALWYTVLPREAGGKLFSEPLGRMVFAIFVVISTPVGFHHQFQDPGIPASWKLLHTFLTMVISFPSLVTAFTICASLEVAGRLRGGKGLFGWIRTLPWGTPWVAAWLLAMLLFLVGGFGGAVNAAYALNSVVHNTAWIQAHFHLTVGSAVALSFMGAAYWLVPKVSGRRLEGMPLAKVQPYLWFLGMCFFSFSNHIAGLMGVPRRVYTTDFGGSAVAQSWHTLTLLSALGGVILFASAVLFVLVMFATLLGGQRQPQEPMRWAEPLGTPPARVLVWDKLGLWFAIAVVLVLIAYGIPIAQHLGMTRFGSPGFKPF